MGATSLIGILIGLAVVGLSLAKTGMDINFFLNFHGLVIVCGGTLAAAAISFPLPKLLTLFKVFFLRLVGKNRVDYQGTIEQMLELNKKISLGLGSHEAVSGIKNDFLKEAVALVVDGVLSDREIKFVLEQRLETIEHLYLHEANMFKTIGKYPPAFGLLATTLGMIALLQKIGQPGAEKMIGPAMAIGLVGTLYGIAMANLIFLPIEEEMALRRMILEGAMLLKQRVNPVYMRESMNSFLLPSDRIRRKAA
jgi:chemotaxis protein MotA